MNSMKSSRARISRSFFEIKYFKILSDIVGQDIIYKHERNQFLKMDRETLRRKIKSMQQTFIQEVRKAEDFMKSVTSCDFIYKPRLAWFSIDEYLKSANVTRTPKENVSLLINTNLFSISYRFSCQSYSPSSLILLWCLI